MRHGRCKRYGLAARHLGQFNGAWMTGEPVPTQPWLSRDWLRDFCMKHAPKISQLPDVSDDPMLKRCFPADVADGFMRLWNEHRLFLDGLEKLPQTICHLDANRRNLFADHAPDGQEQTVAIDWELVGVGAVGQELGPLSPASVFWGQVQLTDLRTLDEMVFNGYLQGLYDAGWRGDPQVVRLGYTLTASLRHGLAYNGAILSSLLDASQPNIFERLFVGIPIEEVADRSTDSQSVSADSDGRSAWPDGRHRHEATSWSEIIPITEQSQNAGQSGMVRRNSAWRGKGIHLTRPALKHVPWGQSTRRLI